MATLAQQTTLVQNSAFTSRCLMAAVRVAAEVMAEPEDTEYHAQRLNLARQVYFTSEQYRNRFALAVATDPAIADAEIATPGSAPDDALVARIRQFWNNLI